MDARTRLAGPGSPHPLDHVNAAQAKADLIPPGYGGPQRDAINSVVDNVASDICNKVETLRKQLDEVEQQALEGAAAAKGVLHDYIGMCVRLNDEVVHMQAVIAEMKPPKLA